MSGPERVVVVGASLAGLRAAEALREEGFAGRLTLVGDEPHEPYDRPPLSKAVLSGWLPADSTGLPQLRELDADWVLGVAASRLDLANRRVELADGRRLDFDKVLIATGTRARPWPDPAQAALQGVVTLRTREDAADLRARLGDRPRRVLVIGGGFTGSEIASVCRELDLPVTVAERLTGPLVGALGGAAGLVAAEMQRAHGVDLRCEVTVLSLEGDERGMVRQARFSDGALLDVDLVVVALGAVRNVEWLADSGLDADGRGVVCDADCRAFSADGTVLDEVFVAGDVARWPHPLYDGELVAVEHWGNAVEQARTAAHNMLCPPAARRAHQPLPAFWSHQFGRNIKSVGLPAVADQVMVTQGSVAERRFAAAYGRAGSTVAAVTVNMPRALEAYAALIQERGPFPPPGLRGAFDATPVDAGFVDVDHPAPGATSTPTGAPEPH